MKTPTIIELIDALGWNDFVNEMKIILKRLTVGQKTPQKTISEDVTLDETFDNSIVKIKGDAFITIPENLPEEFSCVFRTYGNVIANFVPTNAVTMDAPKGLELQEYKMATLFRDGTENTFILEGELTS